MRGSGFTKPFKLKSVPNCSIFYGRYSICSRYHYFGLGVQITEPIITKFPRILIPIAKTVRFHSPHRKRTEERITKNRLLTSERNSLSNNLTSTFSGSTPGEGSATQWRTPYMIKRVLEDLPNNHLKTICIQYTAHSVRQNTFGFVLFEGSYSARTSRIVSLSSPRITSVHFIGKAYLETKRRNSLLSSIMPMA